MDRGSLNASTTLDALSVTVIATLEVTRNELCAPSAASGAECVAAIVMCEKHGRRSRGGIPPEFGVGDAKANCPPQISSYRYKNERSMAFKIRQNQFSAGALPRTPLGELTTLPQTP